jgi:hypothetical protein
MSNTSKPKKQSKPLQTASSRSVHPDTPPDSPTWQSGILDIARQFLDAVKSIQASESKEPSFAGPNIEGNTKPAEAKIRTSKSEFKTVDEVYATSLINKASLTFCFAVGIIVFPDIRSWNQHREIRWRTLINIYS